MPTTKVLCTKIVNILLLLHPPGDFTSGLGSRLVCQQHPQLFNDFINQCLSGLRDSIWIPYLDDILCYGKTFDKHLENLKTVLRRLRQFGVKLKAEKCNLFKPEIKYLRNIISEKGYKDNPINTKAIEKLRERPKTVGDLRKLLRFLGYYRQSIKNFSRKAKPI